LVDGSIYSESVCEHAAWISGAWSAGRSDARARPPPGAGKSRPVRVHALGARTALLEELAELDAQRAKLLTQKGRAILEDARAIWIVTGPEG
jgi:hypothetical protein